MPGYAALRTMSQAVRVQPSPPRLEVKTVPPPIGGWNQRDTIPLMDPTDAIRLENWIPDTTAVRLRGGYAHHAMIEATATAVESLIQYAPPTIASAQLFAAIPTAIYNVTAAATASSTAAVVTGQTNGRWQHSQMTNTTGHHIILVNGADQPRMYDGTTWATCSVSATGLTRTNLIGVHNHMNRLWFLEENQNHVWYLATSAVQGVLTKFSPPFRKGGKLMAMGSWTRDGGAGPDDLAAFISSRGECIVYAGTDPSSTSTFGLLGNFPIPDVIGRRCLITLGGELAVLTMQGLLPLSKVMGLPMGATSRTALTDKITGYFRSQFFTTGTAFGWEVVEYPRGNLLVVNVPIAERVTQHQVVMNLNTGAWSKFENINAGCWSLLGSNLYFGSNDRRIYKFDSGGLDAAVGATANVTGVVQHAYTTFGSVNTKRFTEARPLFIAPVGYNPPVSIQTDYDVSDPDVSIVAAAVGGTQWDAGQWDSFQWAGGTVTSVNWQGVTGEGRAGSVAFGVSSSEPLVYNGTDVGYESGNYNHR